MARLTYSSAIPELMEWTDTQNFGKQFFMETHSGNTATFATGDADYMSIHITGTGLTYNNSGDLISGTVTKIVYDHGGDAYLTITNLELDATVAQGAFEFAGIWAMLPAANGRDVVNGSSDHDEIYGWSDRDVMNGKAGNDVIDGGNGDDRLTGGKGSDTFVFHGNDTGRDVITDFDAVGGVGHQDFLKIGSEYNVAALGKNTLITFADGDEIVLLGVKPDQIDSGDFVM